MRAGGNATLEMTDCTITCRVVVTDGAHVLLENCKVEGDVHATDSSTVNLVKTAVHGQIESDPTAKVMRD